MTVSSFLPLENGPGMVLPEASRHVLTVTAVGFLALDSYLALDIQHLPQSFRRVAVTIPIIRV